MNVFNLGAHEEQIRVRMAAWFAEVGEPGFEALTHQLETRTKRFRVFFDYENFKDVPADEFHRFLTDNVWAYADAGEDEGLRAFETLGSPGIKQSIYRMLDRHRQTPFARVWSEFTVSHFGGPILSEILGAVYPDQYPAQHRRSCEAIAELLGMDAGDVAKLGYVRFRAITDDLWQVAKDQPEYRRWSFNQNYNYPYIDCFLAWVWQNSPHTFT